MTAISRGNRTAPIAALLAGAVLFSASPAAAQNLFDLLFGGPLRQAERYPERPPAPTGEAPRRPAPKISAPSYYNYKPDAVRRVDLSVLMEAGRPAVFVPQLDGRSFAESVRYLEGFELAAEKEIADALLEHYRSSPDFIWVSGFHANQRAIEAAGVLAEAADFGLDPADYAVSLPPTAFSADNIAARQASLIRFEMTFSARVLRYMRDAHSGRINPNRLSGYHDFPAKPLNLAGLLDRLKQTGDVRYLLQSQHPQNAAYAALRAELARLRASQEEDIVVDPKTFVRPGGSHKEMPKLVRLMLRDGDDDFLAAHRATLEAHLGSETYAEALVPAVKAAQEARGLKPDGIIGPRTVEGLAGHSVAGRIEKVILAMERLRWHPSELGSPRVVINQPAFEATFHENGEDRLTMRVVIGKPSNQTSFFYDEIEQVDYNPYWGVPRSILVNEMLPRLLTDPGYLDRAGYEVTDSKGRRIPSSSIDWGAYGARIPYNVRQTPSEANALGELKILFPNKHAIYMHDTPQKHLFDRDTRAYSHGCVRLADPRGMAAAVLGTTRDHVAQKLARGHSSEKVSRRIPVYVAYFTAWPNAKGEVGYHGDIYGRDERLRLAIEKTSAARAPSG